MITFESKLEKLNKGEIKLYYFYLGEYWCVFSTNNAVFREKRVVFLEGKVRSADVQARLPEKRWRRTFFLSEKKCFKSSYNPRLRDKEWLSYLRILKDKRKAQVKKAIKTGTSLDKVSTRATIKVFASHRSSIERHVVHLTKIIPKPPSGWGQRKPFATDKARSTCESSKISSKPRNTNSNSNELNVNVNVIRKLSILGKQPLIWYKHRLITLSGDVSPNPGPRPRTQPDQPQPRQPRQNEAPDQETAGDRSKHSLKVQVKTVTYNVRGLNDQNKVRHLINLFNRDFLNKEYDTVIALQETNILKPGLLPYIWRGNFALTPGTGNSKGCITLLSSHLNVVEQKDFGERCHILVCQRTDSSFANYIIVNVYAPNQHNSAKLDFFEEVMEQISELEIKYNCNNVILLGDLNVIFKESEKKNRLFSQTEKRVSKVIHSLFRDSNLTDIWKNKGEHTWRRANTDTFSTLDRILYRSEFLTPRTPEVDWSLGYSDHAAVKVNFEAKADKKRARGTRAPRLDPSILKDDRLKKVIYDELILLMGMAPAHWDPHMKLEYAKMSLRSVAERVQAERNKRERTMENEIDEAVNRAIRELAETVPEEERVEIVERIENLRNKKLGLIEEKGHRLAERLATKWYNEGERSTRYFYRILNRQMPDKMESLVDDQGRELKEEKAINEAVVNFYKDLYERDDKIVINQDDNFLDNIVPISGDKASDVVREITADDLMETLKNCKDSAPGPDGINYSYLKEYWDIFGPLIADSWKHSRVTGSLPESHKMSILRLIPKAGKDLKKLTNWRPITLSNCDHKLITKTYSTRLTKQLESSIGNRQTAYLKGRVITDNVRALISCVKMSHQDSDIDCIITSLDARKAFDSVNHNYIRSCLKKFGLELFIPIFNTLYKDLVSDIAVNGSILKGYKILRGVKQGDALSCILFIMCMEPMLRNIEENRNIKPVVSTKFNIVVPKAFAYADDVNLVSKNDRVSIKEIFGEYERLTKASGLLLNADKTEMLRLCKNNQREAEFEVSYMEKSFKLKSQPEVKINGILFQRNDDQMRDVNVAEIGRKMKKKLEPWSRRNLSLIGKILLTKTFGISQSIYLMQCFALTMNNIKFLNSILYKFLWNRHFNAAKAPERIKREIINKPVLLGGYGMLDLGKLDNSIKLRILGRTLVSSHPFSSIVKDSMDLGDFFFPKLRTNLCSVIEEAVGRLKTLRGQAIKNRDLVGKVRLLSMIKETKIKNILTPNGLASITYFRLNTLGVKKIGQLDRHSFDQISRIIREVDFAPWIEASLQIRPTPPTEEELGSIWFNDRLVNIASMTTKQLREAAESPVPITSFKIGLDVETNEGLTWCLRIKKLTSARHQNTILKVAHGDIYSNDRLLRFGLRDNDICDRCGNPDSRTHRLATCPKAIELWNEVRRLGNLAPINSNDPEILKKVLGVDQPIGDELAINAEFLQILGNTLDSRIMTIPPKIITRIALQKLHNLEKGKCKENVKDLLDKMGT